MDSKVIIRSTIGTLIVITIGLFVLHFIEEDVAYRMGILCVLISLGAFVVAVELMSAIKNATKLNDSAKGILCGFVAIVCYFLLIVELAVGFSYFALNSNSYIRNGLIDVNEHYGYYDEMVYELKDNPNYIKGLLNPLSIFDLEVKDNTGYIDLSSGAKKFKKKTNFTVEYGVEKDGILYNVGAGYYLVSADSYKDRYLVYAIDSEINGISYDTIYEDAIVVKREDLVNY